MLEACKTTGRLIDISLPKLMSAWCDFRHSNFINIYVLGKDIICNAIKYSSYLTVFSTVASCVIQSGIIFQN